MICRRKFTLGMFEQTVRNFCPKFVRNERKSVQKLNVRIFNVRNVLQVMYHIKSRITCTTFNAIYMIQCRLCNIYNTLGKLNVASKTVSMNIDDQYSTLLLIISIQRFQNTFSAITTPTPMCYLFLLKNLKMNAILSGRHVRLTLFTRLRLLSL